MSDEILNVDLELAAFLGSDFAQSVSAELGEEVVSKIWLEGYAAAQSACLEAQSQAMAAFSWVTKSKEVEQ